MAVCELGFEGETVRDPCPMAPFLRVRGDGKGREDSGAEEGLQGLGVLLPTALDSPTAAGARMKNQLMGSSKGSPTTSSRGWVGIGATDASGRVPTPHSGRLLGCGQDWSHQALVPGQGVGGTSLGLPSPWNLWLMQW